MPFGCCSTSCTVAIETCRMRLAFFFLFGYQHALSWQGGGAVMTTYGGSLVQHIWMELEGDCETYMYNMRGLVMRWEDVPFVHGWTIHKCPRAKGQGPRAGAIDRGTKSSFFFVFLWSFKEIMIWGITDKTRDSVVDTTGETSRRPNWVLASPHQKNLLIYSNFLLKYHISFASKVITLCATVSVGPSQYIMFMFALLVVEDRM